MGDGICKYGEPCGSFTTRNSQGTVLVGKVRARRRRCASVCFQAAFRFIYIFYFEERRCLGIRLENCLR